MGSNTWGGSGQSPGERAGFGTSGGGKAESPEGGLAKAKNFLRRLWWRSKKITPFSRVFGQKVPEKGYFWQNVPKSADFFPFAAFGGENFFGRLSKFCLGGG